MELDWVTFALEIVNFLVLIWVLQRFLYKPVLAAIARRKAAIEKNLSDAKALQVDAQALEQQYRNRLVDWEREKEQLRAGLAEEINAERARLRAGLQAELEQEREKNRVLEERRLNELRRRAEDQAVVQGAQFAARLLARIAAPELETRLVALVLEDLARLPEDRLQALRAACRDAGSKMKVTSAFPLDATQRQALVQGFKDVARADVAGEFSEDPRLLAGLRIGIGAWVAHANLQEELKVFAEAVRHGA